LSQNFYHITDDLLVKYLLGEATAEERVLVEEWIANDVANKKQYDDFKTIWEESKRLATVSTVNKDAAWQRFKNRVQQTPKQKVPVRKLQSFNWMRIAALFMLIIGVAWFGYYMLRNEPVKNLVVTSQQKPMMDTLPDGSVVTLNKNSVINYPSKFKENTRTVTLKGEAFFNVTPDKKKPFIININDVTIRVVGTSFNVRSDKGTTEVIVESGIVQVTRKNETIELKPEEKVKISQQDTVLAIEKEEEKLYNYYFTKEFVCEDTPLWKLVEVLKQAYNADIVIENKELRNQKLDVPFVNESLDRVLEVVGLTLGFEVEKENDRYILK
jgi:transmembrane sensor